MPKKRAANLDFSSLNYQTLFEAAPGLFLVLLPDSPTFTIVGASRAYLDGTNTERKKIIGKGLFEIFPDNPADPKATGTANLRTSLERAIKQKVPDTMAVQKYDIPRPKSKKGGFEIRYWSPLNTPVLGTDNKVMYLIHRVEDVTEFMLLKQRDAKQARIAEELLTKTGEMELEVYQRAQEIQKINKELEAANNKLNELDKLKTQFFSNISHEFRTPLTLILGPVEQSLTRTDLPDDHVRQLELVRRNTLRLQKLVNSLLNFAQIEAGKMKATFQPVELASYSKELASAFESAIQEAGLSYIIDCKALKHKAYVDPNLWETIVLNLLSNALKFTFKGYIKLKVQETNKVVELVVEDTGIGIAPTELEHLFERFHRIEGAKSRSAEGSGIGLALVHELVKLHGGTVSAISKLGKGTTFIVRVPLGMAHLPKNQIANRASAPLPGVTSSTIKREALDWFSSGPAESTASKKSVKSHWNETILVVDDNPDMLEYIHNVLDDNTSYQIVTAKNGQEALTNLKNQMPKLIVTDVMMPEMDGFEFVSKVRKMPEASHVPIIFLSARAGEKERVEGIAEGSDVYLTKPFSAKELATTANTLLNLATIRQKAQKEELRVLRELNTAKDEFLSIASHQLRTPATGVKLYIGLLQQGYLGTLTEKQRRALDQANTSNERQLKIINDLLQIATIDAGRIKPRKALTDIVKLTRDVLLDQGEKIQTKHQLLTLNLPNKTIEAEIDEKLIRMVFENLIDNASKYTQASKKITVDIRADKTSFAASVQDEGIGISQKDIPKLFRKFSRIDNTDTASIDGSGLGLYWVKKVVEAHHGTIQVESKPHKGSNFTITMPLRAV